MKKIQFLFSIALVSTMLIACVTSESELLKQARSIQDEVVKSSVSLDSTMGAKLTVLNSERSEMAMDTTMSTDSIKIQSFMVLKNRIDNLAAIQSELQDWRSNMKMLPSAKDIDGGAENPFGEKAKDQEILGAIKKSQEEFNNLKMKADAAMK